MRTQAKAAAQKARKAQNRLRRARDLALIILILVLASSPVTTLVGVRVRVGVRVGSDRIRISFMIGASVGDPVWRNPGLMKSRSRTGGDVPPVLVRFLSRSDRSGPPDCSSPLDRSDKPADQPGRSRQKMAENGAFSRAKKRHFRCLEPGFLNTSRRFDCFYVGRPFWRPGARKMSGAVFGRGPFST